MNQITPEVRTLMRARARRIQALRNASEMIDYSVNDMISLINHYNIHLTMIINTSNPLQRVPDFLPNSNMSESLVEELRSRIRAIHHNVTTRIDNLRGELNHISNIEIELTRLNHQNFSENRSHRYVREAENAAILYNSLFTVYNV